MCLMLWFRAIWNCLPVLPFSPVRYPLQGPIRLQTKLRQPLTYVCMRMYICIFSYMHTYIHICIYVCICVHTHTHRNLYAGQEATVRTGHGTKLVPNWERSMSRLILSPCLFNLYAEYIMRNAGLDEAQV